MYCNRSLLLVLIAVGCAIAMTAALKEEDPILSKSPDYLDDIKDYAAHHSDEISHKWDEQINKMNMMDEDDYPDDEEGDYDDEDYDDEDDEDYDDEDGGGGCGGGDDDDEDDEDYEDEELSPVEEVIDEYFTR